MQEDYSLNDKLNDIGDFGSQYFSDKCKQLKQIVQIQLSISPDRIGIQLSAGS